MTSIIKPGIGDRVHSLRTALGVSQLKLAKGALSEGASAKNIGRIEQGEVTPTLKTLAKIAYATNVDVSWLVTGQAQMQEGKPVRVPGIGRRLSAVRANRGLSQRKTAAFLSESPSAKNVGRIEAAEVCPMPETLRRLADGLGTTVNHLVNGA
jgi:transcriptional regulator with XRE-family HTH domain